MHLCVFEDDKVDHLLPLVHTRAVYDLRLGMRTLLETTRDALDRPPTILHARRSVAQVMGEEYGLLTNRIPEGLGVLFVNGRFIAENGPVLDRIRRAADKSEPARVFVQGDEVVAAWVPEGSSSYVEADAVTRRTLSDLPEEQVTDARFIERLWHLLDELPQALERDYAFMTGGLYIYERPGADIQEGAVLAGSERIHIGAGASVFPGAILNAHHGPIYIDEGAEIQEGAVLKGPAYVGPKSVIMSGADIELCAFGHWSKVGGQVDGTIIHSLTNKAHSGYLGDAYVGRWCNLGADTNNSNLKNDYGEVALYDTATGDFERTGRQFLGLIMGDHTKTGINTMFTTGTVVGTFCNVYGAGFNPKYIPSFSWGGPDSEFVEYRLDKAIKVAEAVMERRNAVLTDAAKAMLQAIFEATRAERELLASAHP